MNELALQLAEKKTLSFEVALENQDDISDHVNFYFVLVPKEGSVDHPLKEQPWESYLRVESELTQRMDRLAREGASEDEQIAVRKERYELFNKEWDRSIYSELVPLGSDPEGTEQIGIRIHSDEEEIYAAAPRGDILHQISLGGLGSQESKNYSIELTLPEDVSASELQQIEEMRFCIAAEPVRIHPHLSMEIRLNHGPKDGKAYETGEFVPNDELGYDEFTGEAIDYSLSIRNDGDVDLYSIHISQPGRDERSSSDELQVGRTSEFGTQWFIENDMISEEMEEIEEVFHVSALVCNPEGAEPLEFDQSISFMVRKPDAKEQGTEKADETKQKEDPEAENHTTEKEPSEKNKMLILTFAGTFILLVAAGGIIFRKRRKEHANM